MQAKTYVGQDETRKPQVARFLRPAALLRVEGVVLLVLSVLLYRVSGGGWLMFGVLMLAPDLSMLGYLAGPRVGAAIYNAFHTYALPAAARESLRPSSRTPMRASSRLRPPSPATWL